MINSALLTDLYQLTMLYGYYREGMVDSSASFDLFFRTNPYQGSFAVFAGLEPALNYLQQLRFTEEELNYLATLNLFDDDFLNYLRQFKFRGEVIAAKEGTVVFAGTPIITVKGSLAEAQLVETALLNIINFQTLVATKAARLCAAAGDASVLEFGLRRAQGPDGALSVARAAAIGGVSSTSNVLAGKEFGLPLRGTHAHSWIMAFPDELAAFRAYSRSFPNHCTLLVDTYDTLKSGIPNAIRVAGELRSTGHELFGIRIDSGDLAYLSRQARGMLDAAGFPDVAIIASNDLDEFVIHSIRSEGGMVDYYGVGTRLATCAGSGGGALGGVYKLVESNGTPRMKLTGEMEKSTLPGEKQLFRVVGDDNRYIQDVVCLANRQPPNPGDTVFAPHNPLQSHKIPEHCTLIDIREQVMDSGEVTVKADSLKVMEQRCHDELQRLPEGSLRLINPHRYKVSICGGLQQLRADLISAAVTSAELGDV